MYWNGSTCKAAVFGEDRNCATRRRFFLLLPESSWRSRAYKVSRDVLLSRAQVRFSRATLPCEFAAPARSQCRVAGRDVSPTANRIFCMATRERALRFLFSSFYFCFSNSLSARSFATSILTPVLPRFLAA